MKSVTLHKQERINVLHTHWLLCHPCYHQFSLGSFSWYILGQLLGIHAHHIIVCLSLCRVVILAISHEVQNNFFNMLRAPMSHKRKISDVSKVSGSVKAVRSKKE
jgi:hypothetical protein